MVLSIGRHQSPGCSERDSLVTSAPTVRDSADAAANDLRRDLLRQCEVAEYAMRANQVMSFFVPEHRGHDDLLNAAALVVQAQPIGKLRTAVGDRRAGRLEPE